LIPNQLDFQSNIEIRGGEYDNIRLISMINWVAERENIPQFSYMKKLIAESASIAFKQKLTKAQIIVLIGLWNHSLTMLRPLETLMPLMFNVENLNRLGGLDFVNSLNDLRNQALNNPTGGFNRDQRLWGVPKNRGNGNTPSPSKAPGQPSPSVRAMLKKMESLVLQMS
jgi:hypothetical protein